MADVATVLGQARPSALGVEVVLVPVAMLRCGRGGILEGRGIEEVGALAAHQAAHTLGLQRGDDAGGTSAPVVARQGGAPDAELLHELHEIVSQRRLLARAQGRCREEARRAVAAQPGHQHSAAVGRESRGDLVVGTHVIRKAVKEKHRRAVRRPVLFLEDLQHVGADTSLFHPASLARCVDRGEGRAHAWRNGGNMARFDRVIRGGMIVDGSRLPRLRGDIGIKDGRIAEIGQIGAAEADETIDAGGLIVAPGFVDLHTHYDAQLFWDPYCTLSSWHGITSVVIGNCGFGFAPVRPAERERAMLTMTRVEAIPMASMQKGMPWSWVTFPEFLDAVDRAPKAVNILPYVPVSPLLIWVMGFEAATAGKRPTPEQHAELRRLLHEAMDAGACGWSAQRMLAAGPAAVQRDYDGSPMPTDVMHDDTCREFAKVLAERNDGFMQMLLVSGDNTRDRLFYEELATLSGRPI